MQKGFCVASYDGRANISLYSKDNYSNNNEYKRETKMSFKCHKKGTVNSDAYIMFPTHNILTHPRHENFLSTCGGDGRLVFWDFKQK